MLEPEFFSDGEESGLLLVERRAWLRFPLEEEISSCDVAERKGVFLWTAQIQDFSAQGIGLCVDRPFEPGVLLAVKLQSRTPHLPQLLLARVRHVTEQAAGNWIIGCEFMRPLAKGSATGLQGDLTLDGDDRRFTI